MNNPVSQTFQPTKDDLLIILQESYQTLSTLKKLSLFEKLTELYHQNRDFNLYAEAIYIFFDKTEHRFHLGKTSLDISRYFKRAVRIVDILSKHEAKSQEKIPEEHAKYLFALIKEFVYTIERMVNKNEFDGDYLHLANQLISLKTVMEKGKNNADVMTVLDNVIRSIQKSNPVLLAAPTESHALVQKETQLTLNTPLSKMSKKTFTGLLENVYAYQEKDFYKICEYAFNKYDDSIFREANLTLFPLYITILKHPSKKMNFTYFSPESFLKNYSREKVTEQTFYPLEQSNIEGFYELYLQFLNNLEKENVIGEVEKRYLHFKFLKSSHQLSDVLANHFIEFCEKIIDGITSRMKVLHPTKISDLLSSPFTYTHADELFLNNSDSHSGSQATISLSIKEGKFKCEWHGLTKKVPDPNRSFFDMVVPREDITVSEFDVAEDIQTTLLNFVKKYKSNPSIRFSDKILEYIHLFDILTPKLEVDVIDEEKIRYSGWRDSREKLLSRIFINRFEQEMLTDNELSLLFSSDYFIQHFSFQIIDSHILISYLKKVLEKGIIDASTNDGLSKLYRIRINDLKLKDKFMFTYLESRFPNEVRYLSSLVEQDQSSNELSNEEKINRLVSQYFSKKLQSFGLDTVNYIV